MSRTLVIGDIHGGLKALQQVISRAAVNELDKLIFLGDYVDGWSDSAAVVSYLVNLQKSQACIFIKGNHDVWCENWLRSKEADPTWLLHGGKSTVDAYARMNARQRAEHMAFFEGMLPYYIDQQNRLFIHAGFSSLRGPQYEMHTSNFQWDRTLWEMAIALDKSMRIDSEFYPKRLQHFNEIYIGHTPTINYNIPYPMQASTVWNVDTGAAFTGRLTVLDVDTKSFWQSDELRDLYPGEPGRNAR